MNRPAPLAIQLILSLCSGFPVPGAAQTPRAPYRPLLLPGCALPSAKLIAAAAPVDVELTLAVVPSGTVVGVEMSRSSGHPEFDAAFASAAQACRFEPVPEARLEGRQSVEHKVTIATREAPRRWACTRASLRSTRPVQETAARKVRTGFLSVCLQVTRRRKSG